MRSRLARQSRPTRAPHCDCHWPATACPHCIPVNAASCSLASGGRQAAMARKSSLAVSTLVLLACAITTRAGNATADECRTLGFTGLALCSDCEQFENIVHDEGAESRALLSHALTRPCKLQVSDSSRPAACYVCVTRCVAAEAMLACCEFPEACLLRARSDSHIVLHRLPTRRRIGTRLQELLRRGSERCGGYL